MDAPRLQGLNVLGDLGRQDREKVVEMVGNFEFLSCQWFIYCADIWEAVQPVPPSVTATESPSRVEGNTPAHRSMRAQFGIWPQDRHTGDSDAGSRGDPFRNVGTRFAAGSLTSCGGKLTTV